LKIEEDEKMNKIMSTISALTILIVAILLPYTCAIAQNPEWVVYDTSNSGLPSNCISSIAIDGSGTKWIGTFGGGLAVFDGSNWTVYNTSNSGLPSNEVFSMAIDGSGAKWIGTDRGLAFLDGINWMVYDTSNSELPSDSVFTIVIDDSGTKWMGGTDGFGQGGSGLTSFDGTTWTVYNTSNSDLPHNAITSIAVDNSGAKWIGTHGGGLASFDGINWSVYNTSNSALGDDRIASIAIEGNGTLWIGERYGLSSFDGSNWTGYELPKVGYGSTSIASLAIDDSGIKWIGMGFRNSAMSFFNGVGLCRYDNETWVFYDTSNSGLPSDNISSIVIDTEGNKWLSTTHPEFQFISSGVVVFSEGGAVAVNDEQRTPSQPSTFKLDKNYPNPFNPTTTISYSLLEAGSVELLIYDLRGRIVKSLQTGYQSVGSYYTQWNGLNDQGLGVPTGVYFARLQVGNFTQTIKMIYLK